MIIWYILPLSVGICIVLQGILNKQFSIAYGLSTAALLNAIVFAVMAYGFFVFTQRHPLAVPDFLPPKLSQYEFHFWHLVPGIAGFIIVFFTPWSIRHLGAAQVYVLIISAQILFSSIWDHWANEIQFSLAKIAGLILVAVGATLFSLAK